MSPRWGQARLLPPALKRPTEAACAAFLSVVVSSPSWLSSSRVRVVCLRMRVAPSPGRDLEQEAVAEGAVSPGIAAACHPGLARAHRVGYTPAKRTGGIICVVQESSLECSP